MQLANEKRVPEDGMDGASPSELAAAVGSFIATTENAHHIALGGMYSALNKTAIKPMRRRLPLTGTKMNWSTNAHSVAQALGSSS